MRYLLVVTRCLSRVSAFEQRSIGNQIKRFSREHSIGYHTLLFEGREYNIGK